MEMGIHHKHKPPKAESCLGIGLYSLAGVYGSKDLAEIQRMLLQAIEWGIDFFDVSDQYGPAEEVLGATLKPYRQRIRISTKVGLTANGGRNCSREHILAACHRSLTRLQTDYIDYYQIHFDDPATPILETVSALEELRRAGLIREYNIGHLPVKKVQEYIEKGRPSAVMMELSPLALKQYQQIGPLCTSNGLGIIAMGTSGRGLLTGKIPADQSFPPGDIRRLDPLFQHSLRQSAYRILHKLEQIGSHYGKSPVQVALNWVARQKGVQVVLTGPSTVEHLTENLGALHWTLDGKHSQEFDDFIQAEEEQKYITMFQEITDILQKDLPGAKEQIVCDLIYVISGLIEMEHIEEQAVLPLFQQLMLWNHTASDSAVPRDIQSKLKSLL